MNDKWVEDLRAEPVDTTPRPGFKDELRATLIAERNGTTAPPLFPKSSRRVWLLGAAAACVALLIGGLLLFNGDDEALTPATIPEPTTVATTAVVPPTTAETPATIAPESTTPVTAADPDLVVSEPQAISLDQWIEPATTFSVSGDVVAIDRQSLPDDWSVSDEDGRLLVYPNDMSGYMYTATVTTGDQSVFDVTFSRDPFKSDACFLPTAGFPGTVGDLSGATVGDAVCGQTADGNNLAVVPKPSTTDFQASALDVANTLTFVTADDVPHPDLTAIVGDEEPADVAFAGTLSGARWAMTVEPTNNWKLFTYIAGNSTGGMEGISQSIGEGEVQLSGMDSVVEGVPGYGALAYGHVQGDAVAVVVTTDDGRTARLPMLPGDGRSAFVVPIPDSVRVATLAFVIADGSVLAVVDVPEIPRGYGGGSLSIIPPR